MLGAAIAARTGGDGAEQTDLGIEVGNCEIRNRIPLIAGTVDDALQGRAEPPIRPTGHIVAYVNDETTINGRGADPFSASRSDFETGNRFLQDDGESGLVRVGPVAESLVSRLLRRVVQEGDLRQRLTIKAVEIVFFDVEGQGEGTQQVI